jgi:hypothetical protein
MFIKEFHYLQSIRIKSTLRQNLKKATIIFEFLKFSQNMKSNKQRTPEEIQALKDEIQKNRKIQDEKDAIRKVKNGQIIIFILAAFMAISSVVEYYMYNEMIEVFYIYAPLFTIFILLGAFYYSNPFLMSIIALSVYVFVVILAASADPEAIVHGIFIKVIIIIGLVRSIKYAQEHKKAIAKSAHGELLDDEFTTTK